MLKISAELRLKYSGESQVKELLNNLKSYKSLIDPCSGTQYKWNNKNKTIYSIGLDRKDNKGKQSKFLILEGDITLPVILYVK